MRCPWLAPVHNPHTPPLHWLSPLQEHLRGEALKTNELLRHLWGALPLLSAARADKAAKLARHLGEQRALLRSHMEAHPGGGEMGCDMGGKVHPCGEICLRMGRRTQVGEGGVQHGRAVAATAGGCVASVCAPQRVCAMRT